MDREALEELKKAPIATVPDYWLVFSVEGKRIIQECETIVAGRTYHADSKPDRADVIVALWMALKDAESRALQSGGSNAK